MSSAQATAAWAGSSSGDNRFAVAIKASPTVLTFSRPCPCAISSKRSTSASSSAKTVLGNTIALEGGLVGFEAETGWVRHDEPAVLWPRHLFEEAHQPWHVFDRQPVRHRADQVDMDLGNEMADHRQIEGFGHAGDLHPLRDTADPHQVDHDNVDRVP